ncbi:hypothetical protein AA101099_0553 [Neoasaia chiangmaiensis NBRC 101099]|nr:hypothetical protein AA101099_0553 [Neoasaia chiangmaiensis NBRC 101099]GEN16553.1 hypothetical protein NCH01_29840 [Neoasaia chiangmaiensis]
MTVNQAAEARNAGQTDREVPVVNDEPGSWHVGLPIGNDDKAQRTRHTVQHEVDAIRTIMPCPRVWRETG